MAIIKAVIEGADFQNTHEFTSDEVVAYHMPDGHHGWNDLSGQDQTSFAEDYALWAYYRKYGNHDELRVDVTFELSEQEVATMNAGLGLPA